MSTTSAAFHVVEPRTDLAAALPEVYQAQARLSREADKAFMASGLPRPALELLRIRASQLNGCAFCLDMHTKDARHAGEQEDRLYLLDAWREAPHYSDVERAVLALTEAVTLVSEGQVPDEVWEACASVLTPEQMGAVVAATAAINVWNRFAISSRTTPGGYQPA